MEINICPRWLLTKLGIPAGKQLHFALLFSSVLVLAAIPLVVSIPHFCLMQAVFGIPCPGCGVLHALTALVRFHGREAWRANPASFAIAALFVFQMVARPVAIVWTNAGDTANALSRRCSGAVIAFLLSVWALRII